MLNDLTKKLYAEGWTREKHPDYVFWGDFENFSFCWEYALTLVWETPCGLLAEGRSLATADTSYGGVWYCPENGNPLLSCPYHKKSCEHIPEGLRSKFAWCPCHLTDRPYDYEHSAEKVEHEADRRRKKQYMELTGGQCCACVVGCDGYNGGLVEVKYDVQTCINMRCQNEFCSIRKKRRDLRKVNIFYDIRRTFITRQGFFEDTTVKLEKGRKVFPKPVAKTDAELWLAMKKATFDPIKDKHIVSPKLSGEDRRMEYFSKHHRSWPGYEYFEFHYEVENIRIEARETRDLLQDLRDAAEGISVIHASDQEKAAKQKKRDAKEMRREQKERAKRKRQEQRFLAGELSDMTTYWARTLGKERCEELLRERGKQENGSEEQISLF